MLALAGIPWTIMLTICCVEISNVAGFLVSLMGLSDKHPLQGVYRVYVVVSAELRKLEKRMGADERLGGSGMSEN
jgi:ABC-type amino acid transport system permease subunit